MLNFTIILACKACSSLPVTSHIIFVKTDHSFSLVTILPSVVICLSSTGDLHNIDRAVKKCLIESFKKLDEEFLAEAAKSTPSWKDGCTAAVLLVVNDVIFSGNLGDSRAVLYQREDDKSDMKCVQLTKDHTPANVSPVPVHTCARLNFKGGRTSGGMRRMLCC